MDFVQQVRLAIYRTIVSDGRVPSLEHLAAAHGWDAEAVSAAYRDLAEAHVIVLEPGSLNIWSAPPFSAVQTPFRVRPASSNARESTKSWCAPCAWDAFGIAAVLREDVTIEARCPESGEPLPAAVRGGRATGRGLLHLEVPARRFWDDIFYT